VKRFLEGGGKLLAFLDPETMPPPRKGKAPEGLPGLLASYGMEFRHTIQANDRFYARRTFTKADHALLVTNGYLAHPALSALRREAKQNPLLLLGAGSWRRGKPPAHLFLHEVLKGMGGTWGDRNGNFSYDRETEKRETPTLAMAVSPKKPARHPGAEKPAGPHIMAFSDADLATDFLMRNRANRLLLSETIRWLAGSEIAAGLPAVEEDTQIRHVKEDELLWFYLPVFGVPLLVLALGYFFSGRPAFWRRG
jgi:hypothetical protein